MLFRMIREIKVSSDWVGCILIVYFYVMEVFLHHSFLKKLSLLLSLVCLFII